MEEALRRRLGERLRSFRLQRRLTQEQLAELAGFHPTYVQKVEAGHTLPSLPALVRLARALGVPSWDILRAVDERPPSNGEEPLREEVAALAACFSGRDLLFARDFLLFFRDWRQQNAADG